MIKQIIAAGILATATIGVGSSAFAGERGGNGEPTPIKGEQPGTPGVPAALCAFSGLEDFDFEGEVQPGEVQTPHGESAFDVVFPPGSARACSMLNFGHDYAGGEPD